MGKKILTTRMLQNKLREYAICPLIICLFAYLPGFIITLFGIRSTVFFFACFMYVCMVLFGIMLVFYLTNCLPLLVLSFCRPIVVIATRINIVGLKIPLWARLMHPHKRCYNYIQFHGYGTLPSTLCETESTFIGDKFYLLLDKFGHVIAYYPCSVYEYEGELTPNKYEK